MTRMLGIAEVILGVLPDIQICKLKILQLNRHTTTQQ